MTNGIERVFTPTEVNKLREDIETVGRKSKASYPVVISEADGKTGRPVVSAYKLNEISSREIKYHFGEGTKEEFIFRGILSTYEYFDPNVREMKKVIYPKMPKMDLIDLYNFTAEFLEFADAQRRLITMNTMTSEIIVNTGLPSVGVVLADKLLGEPGISSTVEMLLRENYIRMGISSVNVNTYLKEHENGRAVTELKDKYITSALGNFSFACREIAKVLKSKPVQTQSVNLGSNGINPSVVADANISVSAVTNMSKFNNNDIQDRFKGLFDSGATIRK